MLRCIDEDKKSLEMIEGDFGQGLPFELQVQDEETITPIDSFAVRIYKNVNGELLVEKIYSNLDSNKFDLVLSKEDSMKLPLGMYYYDLDWYQGQTFLSNLIAKAKFQVKEKAGVPDES